METRGYTLSEIVVAIAISATLLGGTIGLASRAVEALSLAKTRSQTHASLTDALSKLATVSSVFPSVRVFGSWSFDYAVFTNSGKTAWILLGVAEEGDAPSQYRLVSVSDGTYRKRFLIGQELTSAQVRAVLFEPQTAFSVPLYPESAFEGISMASLSAEEYNSGSLADIQLSFYSSHRDEWIGRPEFEIPEFPLSVNVVF